MIKKIKLLMFNIIRHYVKNYVTGNLGKVIEESDYLVCYVKRKKNKNSKANQYIYCQGIKEKDKELAKKYKLYKKIYYLFENMEFKDSYVTIFGYGNNSEIIIVDCKFDYGLNVQTLGKCMVANCFIGSLYNNLVLHAKELTIRDIDLQNTPKFNNYYLRINISADENLIIENLNISEDNNKIKLFLMSLQDIYLSDVVASVDTIKCSCKNLMSNSTTLIANKKLEMEILDDLKMESPVVKDKIANKRLELIHSLKNIRDKCIRINLQKVKKYENKLNSVSLKRVLKK